ncbi:YdbC family protein [Romboutsia sp. 1001216sp1]|uniref:YdbC family protein n=1 Tax=Romboutsia sp. 1001216sp1 TaxID=2986997 RepID=UPI00232F3E7A|nr:PC4/YdbC family ssDNA-binding protein [Romboutsia sp. 1001216sp1]MDB8803742.1 PC4/YdbC family ssDNA-binding protein [Romboutsia sp. 1001216sp1]MDB8806908.1 PC4/YdbC family ssDNA-binding protein [Romboutsia sp. 1001216sp1]MDB8809389.1 PC4/YdbC family ssDNA-binding protein [Romboutsia sp. 1001216sp1]MDB8815138.1 PC4/YdbC family ssDNA-binding protein [Romboutsia sp. 1001216sp1]MDB8817831.1 PC4/YdbC family ssDNA-binding protein [Romboutsia sp. 1001216sp1]
MSSIKYDIVKEVGIISTTTSGWKKELNIISWNNREPKYDLRDWSAEHEKMGKGITLTAEELKSLKELLNNMDI